METTLITHPRKFRDLKHLPPTCTQGRAAAATLVGAAKVSKMTAGTHLAEYKYGSFLKLGVPFLGVPIIRTIVFWGLYWGPLILGNYHITPGANYWAYEAPRSKALNLYMPASARQNNQTDVDHLHRPGTCRIHQPQSGKCACSKGPNSSSFLPYSQFAGTCLVFVLAPPL